MFKQGIQIAERALVLFKFPPFLLEEFLRELPQESIEQVKNVPGFHEFGKALIQIRDAVRSARVKLDTYQSNLQDEYRKGTHHERSHVGSVYLQNEHWTRLFRYLALILDETSSDRRKVPYERDLEVYFEPAESIRDLVQIKDRHYQAWKAREVARDRLNHDTLKGVKASKGDFETVRWELLSQAYEAAAPLNSFLDAQGFDYYLYPDSLSRLNTPLTLQRRPGHPPSGLFAELFQPFVEYICDPNPSISLAVCEFIACEAVYIRGPGDNKSSHCCDKCRREDSAQV